jgi:HSP20 family protein
MALIRWEPVRELNSLQHEMNRLFASFFDTPRPAEGGGSVARWLPAMDLVESDDHFILRADLPGLSEDDVSVELEDSTLTISGERNAEHDASEQGFYRLERAYGTFSRSLTLPKGVDSEGITASFDRGVLEVRIPKPEVHKPKRVSIGVAGKQPAIEGTEAAGSESSSAPPTDSTAGVGA